MKEKILTLLGEIEDANRRQALPLRKARGQLEALPGHPGETAFYLNHYSSYKRVFESVAEVFGNSVEGPGRHKALLERMRLDLRGLRPAPVGGEAFRCVPSSSWTRRSD